MTTNETHKPLKEAVRDYYEQHELSAEQLQSLRELTSPTRGAAPTQRPARSGRETRKGGPVARWLALAATVLLSVGVGGLLYRATLHNEPTSGSRQKMSSDGDSTREAEKPVAKVGKKKWTEVLKTPDGKRLGPPTVDRPALVQTFNVAPKTEEPSAPRHNTEQYDRIYENDFRRVADHPLSTFSIDVDTASYANVRRFLLRGQLPPKDAVRIEELINYFRYDYPQPKGDHPLSITTEVGVSPWNPEHRLVQIGLQGKIVPVEQLPPSNLVFLIDTSGSMSDANKLPLLKKAFALLVGKLRARDRIAIVAYAGSAGLVLPSTPGDEKKTILAALDRLSAGGSTAGGAGIQLAYKVALQNLLHDGNNRVILATDGDFNVGASSDGALVRMIEEKRKSGIFLTVLGFGMGNYKDSRLEKLADKGNGNYAYIDTLSEAKKVMVREFGGTLFTIAKDVKLQIEFNPARVQAYRLIGYENRVLKKEDFNNDKKDAGDLGSGHSVTALYEVVPVGVKIDAPKVDPLKYQPTRPRTTKDASRELLTVKLRYKPIKSETSLLLSHPVPDAPRPLARTSRNFRFASAVAQFGMLLRGSRYSGSATFGAVLEIARQAVGRDPHGYRAEFLRLVELAQRISRKK